MTAPAKRIAWFAKRYDPVMASIRLRLLGPMAYLRQSGLDVVTFSSGDCCRHLDAIILSKHFSEEAIAVAREMRIRGQPVIFDICDNIFEGKKRIDKQAQIGRASCREKSVSVRVDLGGRRIIKKKKNKKEQ